VKKNVHLFFIIPTVVIIVIFISLIAYNQKQNQVKPDPCEPYRTEMKTICDSGVTDICLQLQIIYVNCLTVNKILKPTHVKEKKCIKMN